METGASKTCTGYVQASVAVLLRQKYLTKGVIESVVLLFDAVMSTSTWCRSHLCGPCPLVSMVFRFKLAAWCSRASWCLVATIVFHLKQKQKA